MPKKSVLPPVPRLATLKKGPCTPEQLQAALIQVIELHNELVSELNDLMRSGRIRSSSEARANRVYGL